MKKHILSAVLSLAMVANISAESQQGIFSRMTTAVGSVLNKDTISNFVGDHKLALSGLAAVGIVAVCVAKLPLIKKCLGMTKETTTAAARSMFSASTKNK